MTIDGSRPLAVSANRKCRERLTVTCEGVVLAFNSAGFHRHLWKAALTSQQTAGAIQESLSMDNSIAMHNNAQQGEVIALSSIEHSWMGTTHTGIK